jgi:ribosomal protein S18 acetylase RimI-like enzyme
MEPERLPPTLESAEPPREAESPAEGKRAASDTYPALPPPARAARDWASEVSGTIARADLSGPRPVLRDGVRRGGPEDAAAMAGLQVLSREYAYEQGLVPAPDAYDFDRLVDTWQARLTHPATRTFLGLSAGEPAGFIAAGPSRARISWEAEIYSLHVHPRFWRSRVLHNLAAAALDFLTQRGFAAVRMWVTETNTTVIDTLVARGFAVVDQRLHRVHGGVELAFVQRLQ